MVTFNKNSSEDFNDMIANAMETRKKRLDELNSKKFEDLTESEVVERACLETELEELDNE